MAFRCQRWTVANMLPVAFVMWIISTIWFIYSWLHLWSMLQNEDRYSRGVFQAAVSQTLTLLLLTCFLRAIFTDPGSVPDTPEWRSKDDRMRSVSSDAAGAPTELMQHEVKQTGERRFCKWCDRYKPDRCHHCRVCRSCILRMDHHCPWIANCVGFRNHKYFFLLVFYALLDVLFIIVTMSESVGRAITDETPSRHRFLLVFCMTIAVIMGILLTMFFMLHVWLMLKATTTIEFCEKRSRRTGPGNFVSYDIGVLANMQAVLGSNPLLWLLPVSLPDGQGLLFKRAPFTGPAPNSGAPAKDSVAFLTEESSSPAKDASAALLPNGAAGTVPHGAVDEAGAAPLDSSPPEVTGQEKPAVV